MHVCLPPIPSLAELKLEINFCHKIVSSDENWVTIFFGAERKYNLTGNVGKKKYINS